MLNLKAKKSYLILAIVIVVLCSGKIALAKEVSSSTTFSTGQKVTCYASLTTSKAFASVTSSNGVYCSVDATAKVTDNSNDTVSTKTLKSSNNNAASSSYTAKTKETITSLSGTLKATNGNETYSKKVSLSN
jgi:hypothetical protein